MAKPRLQFLVDGLALLAFVLMLGSGGVLQFSLPRGSPAQGLTLWGWDRHQWGGLHAWASWVFMALLGLHLALHWAWICAVGTGGAQAPGWRRCLGWLALALAGLLLAGALALPWIAQPAQTEAPSGHGWGRARGR